jgi:hypothetical protein
MVVVPIDGVKFYFGFNDLIIILSLILLIKSFI